MTPRTDIERTIKNLASRNDATQLQLLRGALVVQQQESAGAERNTGAGDLIGIIDSTLEGIPLPPQARRTPLNSTDIRKEFTDRLRAGVELMMGHRGTSAASILPQARHTVTEAYGAYCRGHQYGKLFPTAEQLTSKDDINRHYDRLRHDTSILSSDVDEHVKSHQSVLESGEATSRYIEDQHARARIKVAGGWAVLGQAYVEVRTRIEMLAKTEQEEGREASGRLAYLLMTVSPEDLFHGLTGGTDIKEGVSELTGVVKLAVDIGDVFSSAACHKDAEQMMELMAERLFVKNRVELTTTVEANSMAAVIISALRACPGDRCVLKLTNKENHSAVYLVGEEVPVPSSGRTLRGGGSRQSATPQSSGIRGGAKFETIAGQDSEDILYNTLIASTTHIREVESLVKDGLARIAKVHLGPAILEWEVHVATDPETMFGRVDTQLREAEVALDVGLGVAEFERRERRGATGEPIGFLVAHGVLEGGALVKLFPIRSATRIRPNELHKGDMYRLECAGRWMKVIYVKSLRSGPTWSSPSARFRLVATGEKFAQAEEEKQANVSRGEVEIRPIDILQKVGAQIVTGRDNLVDVEYGLSELQDDDTIRVVKYKIILDAQGKAGGLGRKVVAVRQTHS